MRRLRAGMLAAIAVLCLFGCERHKAPAVPPPSKLAADVADAGLLAAAEPFEVLTEAAFTARLLALDQAIATAVATADHVMPALPPEAQWELKTQLDAIAAARLVADRPGVALASAEIYRLFVSYGSPDEVPKEVALLRYAGLRYDADLKARPIRWDDMIQAATFGHRTWAAVEGRVLEAVLHERMSKALNDMADATRRRDAALADDAQKRELELASLLEAYFTARRR